jgi:quercetin dioxygenase-like cupin family protein
MSEWYVRNLREAEWKHAPGRGAVAVVLDDFEGQRDATAQLGFNVFALDAGDEMSLYHREADQEDFLVLQGEATLVVEGEERPLRQWDFFHCPPGTRHQLLGGPCLVVAVASRERDLAEFPGAANPEDPYRDVPPRTSVGEDRLHELFERFAIT